MDNNNNSKKNDDKKESSIAGVIGAIIGVIVLFGDSVPSILGLLVVAAVIGVIIYASKAAKKRQETEGGTAQVTGDDIKTAAKTGFSKIMTEAKKLAEFDDDDHDESDHEDIDPSKYLSEDEKRLKQLKSMLKNGIIDREEYNILVKRFNL